MGSPAAAGSRLPFSGNQLIPCPPSAPAPSGAVNIGERGERPAQLSSPMSPHTSLINGLIGFGGNSPVPGSPLSSYANTESGAAMMPGGSGRPMQPMPPPAWSGAGAAAAGLAARSSKRLLLAAALSSPALGSSGVAGAGGSSASGAAAAGGGAAAAGAAVAAVRAGAGVGGVCPIPRSSDDQAPSPFGTLSGSVAAAEAAATSGVGMVGDAATEPGSGWADRQQELALDGTGGNELQQARESGPARASYSGMPSFQFRTENSVGLIDEVGCASGCATASPHMRSNSRRLPATHDSTDLQLLPSVGSGGAVGPATWTPMGLPSPTPSGPVAGGSQKQLHRRMDSQRRSSGLAKQTSLTASAGVGAGVAVVMAGGSLAR